MSNFGPFKFELASDLSTIRGALTWNCQVLKEGQVHTNLCTGMLKVHVFADVCTVYI